MIVLIFLVTAGSVLGALSGLMINGVDGSILGAAAGLAAGTGAWLLIATVERIRRERRLNRHFEQGPFDS